MRFGVVGGVAISGRTTCFAFRFEAYSTGGMYTGDFKPGQRHMVKEIDAQGPTILFSFREASSLNEPAVQVHEFASF